MTWSYVPSFTSRRWIFQLCIAGPRFWSLQYSVLLLCTSQPMKLRPTLDLSHLRRYQITTLVLPDLTPAIFFTSRLVSNDLCSVPFPGLTPTSLYNPSIFDTSYTRTSNVVKCQSLHVCWDGTQDGPSNGSQRGSRPSLFSSTERNSQKNLLGLLRCGPVDFIYMQQAIHGFIHITKPSAPMFR